MTAGRVLRLPAEGSDARMLGRRRPMSVRAMQAAVIAIRAGAFDGPDAQAADPVAAVSLADRTGVGVACSLELGAPAVVVLAGHAGAGASTVALAVAEALSGRWRVQLVEYADPHRSGLGAASFTEMGVDAQGWRRGRRGDVNVARLAGPRPQLDGFPAPPQDNDTGLGGDRLMVLDAGCPSEATVRGSGGLSGLLGVAQLIVVTRVTVPGVRQTEHVLTALGVPAVLATVGAGRWSGEVAASCGPTLRAARAAGRAVAVPTDRRLEISGLTGDPLPKSVTAAGRALAALLTPDQPALTGLAVTPPVEGSK